VVVGAIVVVGATVVGVGGVVLLDAAVGRGGCVVVVGRAVSATSGGAVDGATVSTGKAALSGPVPGVAVVLGLVMVVGVEADELVGFCELASMSFAAAMPPSAASQITSEPIRNQARRLVITPAGTHCSWPQHTTTRRQR